MLMRGGEKINGVRRGREYINGRGKKVVCIGRGEKDNGVFEESRVRSTASEPGNEKLTDVHSCVLRHRCEFANGRALDPDLGK
jgi:hypothetical protein